MKRNSSTINEIKILNHFKRRKKADFEEKRKHCEFSSTETKNILIKIMEEKSVDQAILMLPDLQMVLLRFIKSIECERDKENIELILKVAVKISENTLMKSSFRNFLTILIESEFISKQLNQYVINIVTNEAKNFSKFQNLLLFIKVFYNKIPQQAYKNLYNISKFIVRLLENYSNENETFSSLVNEIVKLYELDKPYDESKLCETHPPDDYRFIDIYPTNEDLSVTNTKHVFLRSNKFCGGYKSVDDYLDVLFRLTREDFIQPLRDGVVHYCSRDKRKIQCIRSYRNISIENCFLSTRYGVTHRLLFNNSEMKHIRWNESKRFLFGSLLCLSCDEFKTVLLATIVERNVKTLSKGMLLVNFESDRVDPSKTYTMLETTNLFESYKHVLVKLQQINSENLSMKKYLVFADPQINPPKYLLNNIDREYNLCENRDLFTDNSLSSEDIIDGIRLSPMLEKCNQFNSNREWIKPMEYSTNGSNSDEESNDSFVSVDMKKLLVKPGLVDSPWPSFSHLKMDEAQFQAFKSSLIKELSIIQGPPGTGKTYLGLRICRTLLENIQRKSKNFGPILIVCYTNHALDQFLEGISEFSQDIIRVGGRSKSEKLEKFTLKKIKQSQLYRENKDNIYQRLRNLQLDFLPLQARINLSEYFVLNLGIVKSFINRSSFGYFQNHNMNEWLLGNNSDYLHRGNDLYRTEYLIEIIIHNEIRAKIKSIVTNALKESRSNHNNSKNDEDSDIEVNYIEKERMIDNNDNNDDDKFFQKKLREMVKQLKSDICANENGLSKTTKNLFQRMIKVDDTMTEIEANEINCFSNLAVKDRWRLYRYWKSQYVSSLDSEINYIKKIYKETMKELSEVNFIIDQCIMRNKEIIGMTTTGAARYGSVLSNIKCKIIIVEEAAEVLESHIITSLNEGCEHLILIGDHKQLKPNPAVYKLAKDHQLDLSLFERLVNNKLHYNTLTLQHRMRPEIADIMKYIYPNLESHSSVNKYPDVVGVKGNLFFLDHVSPESSNDDMMSYSNQFEAEFIVELCQRLLDNGITSSSITILTLYSGQMFLLRSLIGDRFKDVRVCVVDNYQGEENDIILLSLVRSNDEEKIGFLKTENRICVSLSRAKHGLYVVGNFQILEKQNQLWRNICNHLRKRNQLSKQMILCCQSHPTKQIIISNAKDFKKYPGGGCDALCNAKLSCGHICKRSCHLADINHETLKCNENCSKTCDRGHPCKLKCYQKCGPCIFQEMKTIPGCNHTQNIYCYKAPSPSDCKTKCERKLFCGHQCENLCGVECGPCLVKVDWKCSECGSKQKQKCFNLNMTCTRRCKEILNCGHLCQGNCDSCNNDRLHIPCRISCAIKLICGHEKRGECYSVDRFCNRKCEEGCYHTQCSNECGENCIDCNEPCLWQCEHYQCTKQCFELCDRPFCNMKCRKMIKCNICTKEFKCYGICGEMCRNICIVCDKDIQLRLTRNPNAIFITLTTCGHTFERDYLDDYMRETNEEISIKQCPLCKKIINNRSCFRYSNLIKIISIDIKRVQKLYIECNRFNTFLDFRDIYKKECVSIYQMIHELDVFNYFYETEKDLAKYSDRKTKILSISFTCLIDIYKHLLTIINHCENVERKQYITKSLIHLIKWLNPFKRKFDCYELRQFYDEYDRLHMLIQLSEKPSNSLFSLATVSIFKDLKQLKSFSGIIKKDFIDKFCQSFSSEKFDFTSYEEMNKIVELKLFRGFWLKCKSGHYRLNEDGVESLFCEKCNLLKLKHK